MAEADDIEFSDTPYAASFAIFDQTKPAGAFKKSGVKNEQQPTPLDEESRHDANSNSITDKAYLPIAAQEPSSSGDSVFVEPDAVLAEVVGDTLARIDRASEISLENDQEWQAFVAEVLEPIKAIQSQWQSLEAERKLLIKPTQATATSSAGYGVYAGRARGRGRGRGRGRYRGRA